MQSRNFTDRSNCRREARRFLGRPDAKPGVDYEVVAIACPNGREVYRFEVAEPKQQQPVNVVVLEQPMPIPSDHQLHDSQRSALAAAREALGTDAKAGDDFVLRKTARGKWIWRTVAYDQSLDGRQAAQPEPKKDTKPRKAATAETGDGFNPARMTEKFRAQYEAAKNGTLPPLPDFTAATHAPYRSRLAQLERLAKAGDIAGLEAIEIRPYQTSMKALSRYQAFCLIALRAKADRKAA